MQDFCDATLQRSELLVDAMQELIQVCFIKLASLDQNLQGTKD